MRKTQGKGGIVNAEGIWVATEMEWLVYASLRS